MKKSLISALACGLIALLPGCSCDMAKKEAPKAEATAPVEPTPAPEAPKVDNSKMTQSGVKVEVVEATKVADAKKAEAGKKVTVNYTGYLAKEDGTQGDKFDSSADHGSAFSFTLGAGQVIKGWDEGVAELAVGDKARLTIPAQLAYGAQGVPGAIPANANLIFDVELVEVA